MDSSICLDHQNLTQKLQNLKQLAIFSSDQVEQRTQDALLYLKDIHDPNQFSIFMVDNYLEFQKIMETLNEAEPVSSSYQLDDEEILIMLKDLTQLIREYSFEYEPSAWTLIRNIFYKPRPKP